MNAAKAKISYRCCIAHCFTGPRSCPVSAGKHCSEYHSWGTRRHRGNLEVLTDIKGVDFKPYLSKRLYQSARMGLPAPEYIRRKTRNTLNCRYLGGAVSFQFI